MRVLWISANEIAVEDDGFADIVDNDTTFELAVEDDGSKDIVNNNTADELALDDLKKMYDKYDNVENNYLILDKSDIVEKLLLDKDFDIVETLLCCLLILFRITKRTIKERILQALKNKCYCLNI